ncbi:UDP-N-acetylmuramoyl-tripeptide--D-alanyl-D-alanine ligase, partial [Candidatus Desantisbacteria bacterium]|nr:UDP-N-acetylmuramoyl-tripeptide--D-alanyl-D-alanine ligase [Candidatus Desantisbacteria bacterium]
MEQVSLKWLEKVLKTRALGNTDNNIINDISTDTRTIKKGNLFIALKGENFNGNDFISEALKKGAIGAVIQKDERIKNKKFNDFFLLETEDTLSALHKIAKAYRREHALTMVNITGSNGKTTTKEMTYSVLSTAFKTYKTNANFNNEIGVPKAVLSLDNTFDAAVLELGMTHKGDIHKLIKITSPRIRILTNIGPAHLKNFSSLVDIARAKAEIFDCYKQKDIAVFNIDDSLVKKMSSGFPGEKITFGLCPEAIIRAQEIENNGFTLVI